MHPVGRRESVKWPTSIPGTLVIPDPGATEAALNGAKAKDFANARRFKRYSSAKMALTGSAGALMIIVLGDSVRSLGICQRDDLAVVKFEIAARRIGHFGELRQGDLMNGSCHLRSPPF